MLTVYIEFLFSVDHTHTKKNSFWRILVTKQLLGPIDFHSMKIIPWESMGDQKFLVTNILQNIFYVEENKEIHTGLEQLEAE